MEATANQSIEVAKGIFRTPGDLLDGKPRIRDTWVLVSLLEELRRLGETDTQILKTYPELTAQDLQNAWAYIAAHRQEIDKEIEEKGTKQVAPGIFRTPGVCGGRARIRQMRLAVWLLEAARRGGQTEMEILESYPSLTRDDLRNAWAYVATHKEEIEKDIRENL